jgi:hypothetical protein
MRRRCRPPAGEVATSSLGPAFAPQLPAAVLEVTDQFPFLVSTEIAGWTPRRGRSIETGLAICIVHHPPGTSKWNRIEHRMFAFISQYWRCVDTRYCDGEVLRSDVTS